MPASQYSRILICYFNVSDEMLPFKCGISVASGSTDDSDRRLYAAMGAASPCCHSVWRHRSPWRVFRYPKGVNLAYFRFQVRSETRLPSQVGQKIPARIEGDDQFTAEPDSHQ